MKRSEAYAFRHKIESAAEMQTDEQALESIDLFPKWSDDMDAEKDKRYKHNGKLWRCLQSHHTQADWEPGVAPSLWVEVSVEEWPEIPENIPSTAPWMAGDKGTWKGHRYICKMDYCVWNPDVLPSAWEQAD